MGVIVMATQPPNIAPPRATMAAQQSLGARWAALHDAADAVALIAGLAPEKTSQSVRGFPAAIKAAEPWKAELAERGIADISAMMTPGLTALLAVKARGQDATAAALTLWREFHSARSALLALAPEAGNMGPQRSA